MKLGVPHWRSWAYTASDGICLTSSGKKNTFMLVTLRDCCTPNRLVAWPWLTITTNAVCGLTADSDSVHQADNRLPTMRLRSLWYPYPSLHILSPRAASACK